MLFIKFFRDTLNGYFLRTGYIYKLTEGTHKEYSNNSFVIDNKKMPQKKR